MTSVQRLEVPESIRSLCALDRIDYTDPLFVATTTTSNVSPEGFARALVEDAVGRAGQFVWQRMLRLRLRVSEHHVGGWTIGAVGNDWIRLEAASWFVAANIVLSVDERHVSAVVFLRYDHPVARLVCPPVMFAHRQALPTLIREALR
jgi:hypothetical protein